MIIAGVGLIIGGLICGALLRQAHRQAVALSSRLSIGEQQFLAVLQDNEALRSVVCGLSFQVGALEAYLERIERNYADVAARAPIGSAIRVQAIIRSHSADNARFVLKRLFE